MSNPRTFRFGIIGCGLMGREFASAAARWCHLTDAAARPEIVAICDKNESLFDWYRSNFPSIGQATAAHTELLANRDVEAVYCAVPHALHERIYSDVLTAGKHLLGEKPFGIDRSANEAITRKIAGHPDLLVRCASEFPYFPAVQRLVAAVREGGLGDLIEVEAGYLHSSDLNPRKPINWKRQVEANGAYGCMGDLGMHVLHVPLRLGWEPKSVYAQLSNLVPERPDAEGKLVPCETWDNATLHCRAEHEGRDFPMTLKTWRIGPGETDTWYLKVLGTRRSFSYTTKTPKTLWTMAYEPGGAQRWQREDLGYTPLFPSITGSIFEFGFTDAIQQMWAAYLDELAGGDAAGFGCATPQEAAASHRLFTAALQSHRDNRVVALNS
ncbi:MAG: Gfo/Idh/MocA family oxidoreductase [Phycisphaeraceae bacterium]|nr:Gfo/Idh/MocA family oxidoreductase [Phycisphaeraceae bacterium]